ncbi:MAG: 2-oxoacid:acceptor oxidoreductase family protein [Nitrospirae bacterium]|nr:2-oxoacid:acceptor oxidoreductase family protein [Nitrospirota bacterium]MBI5695062.1 2-oxoacid:acceptor oxidoreductase family protein [Nitrospirota bacterium]
MAEILEIRWHGRGGQGTVTAAKVLAEAAMAEGKNVQAFPEYGPERMGAPLRAYNRVSVKPMTLHCQVTNPAVVAVVDPTLLDTVDVTDGTTPDAVFIINTSASPKELRAKMKLKKTQKVFSVDANGISIATIGRVMPNTPMLGAVVKATGVIKLETLLKDIKASFGKKFSEAIINNNLSAATKAYEEVKAE